MSANQHESEPEGAPPKAPAAAGRIVVPVLLLVVGVISYLYLSAEPPEPERPPEEPRKIRTTVEDVALVDYTAVIETRGVVRPHDEVQLTPEVSGKIVSISPAFEDGAYFDQAAVLMKIDDADFRTAVVAAEAQLARSEAAFLQEQARARQAKVNWENLGLEGEASELVLRLPQLREAEANVNAAEAQLEQAERDLGRTEVRAPFDGRVRERLVGLGQSIGPGTTLGTIFSTAFAEVRLPVSPGELAFLDLPEGTGDKPVPVELKDAIGARPDALWHGQIVRTEGTLDESSLELFAIAQVSDPFGRESGHPPLRVGQPVVGAVRGRVLENVYVIPRKAIRQIDRIYLVDKQTMKLDRRIIEPVWTAEDHVVIRDPGIFDNAYLATSQLSYTPDEAEVEIIQQTEAVVGESDGDATTSGDQDSAPPGATTAQKA